MKKVLVLTYYWPPAGGSGVQRWLKFVKYFREFDIEPVVFTVENPNYPITDTSLMSDIPEGIEVIRQRIWEPNSILERFKGNRKESAGFLNPNPGLIGRCVQFIRANYFIPDARKFWIKPSVKKIKSYLKESPVDLIITTGPPHSVHLIGYDLKQSLGIKWIADFRDPWTEIDYFHQLPLTKKSVAKHHELEQKVLRTADKVIVVGTTMKKNYEHLSSQIEVITNGYDLVLEKGKVVLDTEFSILHIGLLNADRNPKILWELLLDFKKEKHPILNHLKVRLVGKVDPSIVAYIEEHGLQSNLEVIPYKPHKEILELQQRAQCLLLSVNNVPSAKGIVTGKIFEYLAVRRPILAIAPKDGDLAKILNDTRAGFVIDFDDKDALRRNLLEMYIDYQNNMLKMEGRGVVQYHRKALTENMAKLIKGLC